MAKTYGYIYMTTNLINGKKYIGQKASSVFVESYKGSGTLITKALNKYGFDNFKVEVLRWCYNQEELDEQERYYIEMYDAVNSKEFYNLASGGSFGNARKGSKLSEEGKRNISEALSGEKNPMYGKHHKKDSCEKMSKRHADFRGENSPSYNRVCINDGENLKYVLPEDVDTYLANGWVLGFTDARIKVLSERGKGRHASKETREKQSLANKGEKNGMYGKKLSDSTKQLLSAQRTGRKWINNGVDSKFVKPEDVDSYILQGWSIGRLRPSEETKRKTSISCTGKLTVHKEDVIKKIDNSELDNYISEGWELGLPESFKRHISETRLGKKQTSDFIAKRSATFKGRIWVNDGVENKWIIPDNLESYFEKGYTKGRLKKMLVS